MTNVSIKDIGEALGLSMMSVSRALRGVEGVSEARRAEILQTAKSMGYRPNRTARSLATARSTLIGVSLPTLFSDVFPEILDGMRATFDHAGFDTVIDTTDYNPAREADWVERMLDWNAAGLVLSGTDHAPDVRHRLANLDIPTLEIWDTSDDPIDICVGVDHVQAGISLARYLLACGYQRPAFIGVPEGRDTRADKRMRGMRDTFLAAGLSDFHIEYVNKRAAFEAGHLGTETVLQHSTTRPDVLCYLNDHMAFGGLSACMKRGISVPGDIGIAGFNGLEINSVLPLPITTLVTQRQMMGAIAARNLVARINGAVVERCVTIPTVLHQGLTTRDVTLDAVPRSAEG